jgi:hypothetical protein
MKTKKLYIGLTIYFLIVIAHAVLSGCSENNSILAPANISDSGTQPVTDDQHGVTIYVGYTPGNPGRYWFDVFNHMQDTIINDFHIQLDSAFTITNYTPRTGWVTDSSSTNTGKGRLGVRCGNQGSCIGPGEHGVPLSGVQLASATVSASRLFNWQATRDGRVVAQGRDTLR